MKTLFLDIETAPHEADVWGLWNVNVSLSQLRKTGGMISFAAKWKGEKKTSFFGINTLDRCALALKAHDLLTEADQLVTWNGDKFDIPMMNAEFLLAGLTPPAPYKSVDLLKVVKKHFRFPSNKLQYVSTALGLDGKVSHHGHQLWTDVLSGDTKAWKLFEKYNKQDVVLLDEIYREVEPWIHNSLNRNLFDGDGCPQCGMDDIQRRGFSYTNLGKFQRYQCQQCGTWFKDTTRLEATKSLKI